MANGRPISMSHTASRSRYVARLQKSVKIFHAIVSHSMENYDYLANARRLFMIHGIQHWHSNIRVFCQFHFSHRALCIYLRSFSKSLIRIRNDFTVVGLNVSRVSARSTKFFFREMNAENSKNPPTL